MIIKEPTKEIPEKAHASYTELRQTVDVLQPGEWLPVDCDSEKERSSIYGSLVVHGPYEGRMRGLTLYLRRKEIEK